MFAALNKSMSHHHFIFTICCTGHKSPEAGKQLTRKEEVSASRERLICKEEEDPRPTATNNREVTQGLLNRELKPPDLCYQGHANARGSR